MIRRFAFPLALSFTLFASSAPAAECDGWWNEMRASMLAFREMHFTGTLPGVSAQVMEMKVVEMPVDKGADAFDVKTKTDIRGLPMKIPGMDDHTVTFNRKKFCAEVAKKDPAVTIDGQSPGAATARVFSGKPDKVEKVKVPAGTFDAEFFTFAIKAKGQKKPGKMKAWVAKVNGHRIPVRTIIEMADMPATFDIQLAKAVKR